MKVQVQIAVLSVAGAVFLGAMPMHAGTVTVTWGNEKQTMDGFGASDMQSGVTLSDAQADLLFDQTNGIGLSIIRVGINYDGSDCLPISNAQKAVARGAFVWGAPWSPPASWKDNNSLYKGGHLLVSRYDDWATRLAGFATMMQSNGVTIYGISAQNEPDWSDVWDTCLYSNQELVNFIKVLGPKLKALNPPVKLIAPDCGNWGNLWGYANAILADATAASNTDILATHDYGYSPQSHAPVSKHIWQTEVCTMDVFDPSISNGVKVANWIHNAITIGNASAWHYWNLVRPVVNSSLIWSNTTTTKRMYTLGNFSKFVRPGYVRIDAAPDNSGGVTVTAYKDKNTGAFAIVAINANGGTADMTFSVDFASASVTPNMTSSSLNLAPQTAVSVSGGRFQYTLPGQSVVTFTGQRGEPSNTLRVVTSHGTVSPAAGSHFYYTSSTVVTNSVASPDTQGSTQYVAAGWTMTGNAPASGTGTNFVMTLTNNATLVWQWNTNCGFTRTAGANGTVRGNTNGWYALGSSVCVTATPSLYYHFGSWTGVSAGQTNENPLTLTMDQARAPLANFVENRSTNGTPHWWLAQYGLATNDSGAAYDDGDGVPAWQEYIAGTDPTNAASYFHIVTVSNLPPWTLYFDSATNRVYTLLGCSNLLEGAWVPLALLDVAGQRGPCSLSDTNTPGLIQSYRIKVSMKVDGGMATGGTVTNYTENGTNYRAHIFTTVGTSSITFVTTGTVEVLVVAGGGGGGSRGSQTYGGGGGGAGGLIHTASYYVASGSYPITVGGGGVGGSAAVDSNNGNGTNSVFNNLTAVGGGGGGGYARTGSLGGSGGGNGRDNAGVGGSGTSGQGRAGGSAPTGSGPTYNSIGGGGGGYSSAGAAGGSSGTGNGGDGFLSSITGTKLYYAGGGGGYAQGFAGGASGSGVGGTGGADGGAGETGKDGRGGGGGGSSGGNPGGGGGSGIVVVRYPLLTQGLSTWTESVGNGKD